MRSPFHMMAENTSVYRRLNPDGFPPEVLGSSVYEEVPLVFGEFDPEVGDVVCDDDGDVRFTLVTHHDLLLDGKVRTKMTMDGCIGSLCSEELGSIDEYCPVIERESSELSSWEVVS